MDDNKCNGWIIENEDGSFEYAQALDKDDTWKGTMVHESCHVDQALNPEKEK